ncbi:50S ribosomal protein L32 [Patescibacteria group bacterium]|nr:MAG: 50S ribosomal protein L32 [Patescibacteria group bacterium]
MGLPGHRRTSSHKRRRAAHFAMKKVTLATCANCKAPVAPHRACKGCGSYGGRIVVDKTRAAKRLVKKARAAAPAAQKTAKAEAKDEHEGHDHT